MTTKTTAVIDKIVLSPQPLIPQNSNLMKEKALHREKTQTIMFIPKAEQVLVLSWTSATGNGDTTHCLTGLRCCHFPSLDSRQ